MVLLGLLVRSVFPTNLWHGNCNSNNETNKTDIMAKTYYQPEWYHDDGTNIDYGGIPDELFSFQAFSSREACKKWLKDNGYDAGDFVIHEYHDDDIEDVTIIA